MTKALHDIYRPTKLSDFIGHEETVTALRGMIKREQSHAFLFSSTIPGIGKTTLARIAAKNLNCENNLFEIPAAINTGVEEMRRWAEMMELCPLQTGNKALILDESQRLSPNAWDSLLKIVEEPPVHAFFFFCTTNLNKVPATIRSRCAAFVLKPLSDDDILKVLYNVCEKERLEIPDDYLDEIVSVSNGSARQALVCLAQIIDAKNIKSVRKLLETVEDSQPALELARLLIKRGSWLSAMKLYDKLQDENPESVRIIISQYFAKVAMGAKTNDQAGAAIEVLDAFSRSYNPSDGHAPLLISIGRALL